MGSHRAEGGRAPRRTRSTPAPAHRAHVSLLPTLVGALVLAVAGLGTLAVGSSALGDRAVAGSRAPSAAAVRHLGNDGTDAIGFTEGDRMMAVSRDSARQALQDAARAELPRASEEQGRQSNAALKSLGRAAEARAAEVLKTQWHLPTTGYTLTARFGQAGGHWSNNHTGLDFAAPTGTPIVAVGTGTITGAGWAGAYGNRTVETLPDGTELWYCHQSAIDVRVGQQVTSGQRIGAVGATGNVTGPHVHLEVRPGAGDPVDPYAWLVVHGLQP